MIMLIVLVIMLIVCFDYADCFEGEKTSIRGQCRWQISTSEGSKSSTHYLGDKNRFDVLSKGPSSGISVGGWGKHECFYTSEYIKTTRDKIETNQMDLIKTRNK